MPNLILPIYILDNDNTTINESGPTASMLWQRSDTGEIKRRYNGQVQTIIDATGSPPASRVQSSTLTRATTNGSATQQVTNVGFQARYLFIECVNDADAGTFSDGWSDTTINTCSKFVAGVPTKDLTKAINVQLNGNGWTATVLGNPQGFDIIWAKVGEGLNVTLKYLAIK